MKTSRCLGTGGFFLALEKRGAPMDTIATEDSLGLAFSERLPLAFTHGRGTQVWDEAGRSYLDFTSGWGVTCLGHAHPRILDALQRQAARLMQGPNAGFT